MKIALVGPSPLFKGGIAQYTAALFRELSVSHQVLFISFKRQYPNLLYPGQTDRDLSQVEHRADSGRQIIDSMNPISWRRAVVEICEFKPQMVIFPWWVMYWAPQFIYMIRGIRRRQRSVRVIFLCHNVTSHESGALSRLLTRLTLAHGDGFVVHSKNDKIDLEAMLNSPRVVQVEHPSYDLPESSMLGREQAQQKLAVSGDVILFFGFIRPYKGLRVLLQAMVEVLAKRECTLIIAGEIWGNAQEYTALIAQLGIAGKVRLIDDYIPQHEVSTYFLASDLVVLPYISATGSGVVKLAYSYHRPVLVTEVGSLPDAVREGETGYVVPPRDASAMAKSILAHLQRGDRLAMEEAVSRHARQFSWESVVKSIEAL